MNNLNSINEIEKLLQALEKQNELSQRKLLRRKEVKDLLTNFDKKVLSFLDYDSLPYRIYESGTTGINSWWEESPSKMATIHDQEKINTRIKLLKKVLNELEPDFLKDIAQDKIEFYFQKGETYESKKKLFFLMNRASKSLYIVDQYLDESILPFVDSLDKKIEIKLLTGKKKSIFGNLYRDLKIIRNNIYAKSFSDCHDRFIVIDEFDVWHLGASINGFGKSAFMLKKIIDSNEKEKFLNDFGKWWADGISFIA